MDRNTLSIHSQSVIHHFTLFHTGPVHGNPLTKGVLKNPIPEVADQNREVVGRYYGFLDEQLAGRDFLATDQFTVADIIALCTMDFAVALNDLKPSPDHANVARWHKAISARPSVKAD